MIYSLLGWIYETFYCTVKEGKWDNRGFLYGPICPIYGTGAVIISVIIHFADSRGAVMTPWQIYCLSVGGSAVLEYTTSWALEKLFHAVWWDYSDLPFNLNGRISLFSSLAFGAGGLLVVYKIVPFAEGLAGYVPPIMIEFLSLCLLFIFAVDLSLTVTALHHFDQVVIRVEDSFNRSMESFVEGTRQGPRRIRQEIAGKTLFLKDQANTMSRSVRRAIQRVSSFRDIDEQKQAVKNSLLSVIKKVKRIKD